MPYIKANICLQVEEIKKKFRSEKYILSYLNTQTKNQMLSSPGVLIRFLLQNHYRNSSVIIYRLLNIQVKEGVNNIITV